MIEIDKDDDVTTRNIKAMLNHGNETRKLLRDMEKEFATVKQQVVMLQNEITVLKQTVAILRSQALGGGPTA